ncbi:hypothetical protein MNEG_14950 [Monoraphidium neglectum]|uniref:Uncharacterized protein n=1 Tax=Monoraphidium neglectum TaxID=145388 RepID=A0A0D2KAG0_9CHLO|nr:hypothetical protein MNEG_14950 [Monoraphidium neglectum]KIY93013.1 hypothetical protein MNEG_14950 [Monoraphidium neglectum]|eukprot:XP_013892033.1 hypothetical protein MNEG_14950 [Monoraphidium neglectum]
MISPAEAERQRQRASISFMYQKPPGLEAALARDRELEAKKKQQEEQQQQLAAAGGAGPGPAPAAPGPGAPSQQQQPPPTALGAPPQLPHPQQPPVGLDRLREDPLTSLIAARASLARSDRFVLKSSAREGVHGGLAAGGANQELLADEPEAAGAAEEPQDG